MRIWLIVCLLASAFDSSAQTWDKMKSTPVGTEVRIVGPRPDLIQGALSSATDDSLVILSHAGQESFPRAEIKRVLIKKPSHRGRNTLIGLGIGAAAGLGIGAGADAGCNPRCFLGNDLGKAIFTPLGALIGTIIGVALPTGGWKQVYKQ